MKKLKRRRISWGEILFIVVLIVLPAGIVVPHFIIEYGKHLEAQALKLQIEQPKKETPSTEEIEYSEDRADMPFTSALSAEIPK